MSTNLLFILNMFSKRDLFLFNGKHFLLFKWIGEIGVKWVIFKYYLLDWYCALKISCNFIKYFQTFVDNMYTPLASLQIESRNIYHIFFCLRKASFSTVFLKTSKNKCILWFVIVIYFLLVYKIVLTTVCQKKYFLFDEYFAGETGISRLKNEFEILQVLRNENDFKWIFSINYLLFTYIYFKFGGVFLYFFERSYNLN